MYVFKKTIQIEIPLENLKVGRLISYIPTGNTLTVIIENEQNGAHSSEGKDMVEPLQDEWRTLSQRLGIK